MTRRRKAPRADVWSRVRDVETPSRAEMTAAESELVELDGEPLSMLQIERILVRAAGSAAPVPVLAGAPTQPGRSMRTLAAAAALLLCMVSIAWVGARVIRPTSVASAYTLTVGSALAGATAQETEASARIGAFTFLDERCAFAIDTLRQLAEDEHAAIAGAAAAACTRIAAALAGGGVPTTDIDEIDVLVEAPAALDLAAPLARRAAATARLERLATAAVVAIGRAPCPTDGERTHRQLLVERLAEELAQPLPQH